LAERPVGVPPRHDGTRRGDRFRGALGERRVSSRGAAPPFWAKDSGGLSGTQGILSSILRVPAGWMIIALLMPAFVLAARVGWGLGREASWEGASMTEKDGRGLRGGFWSGAFGRYGDSASCS
jgi:hypothetical protein